MTGLRGCAAAVLLSVVALSGAGCGSAGGGISKQDEQMMRAPVGQTPMPAEAVRAMQQAQQNAARTAAQQRGGR